MFILPIPSHDVKGTQMGATQHNESLRWHSISTASMVVHVGSAPYTLLHCEDGDLRLLSGASIPTFCGEGVLQLFRDDVTR